MRPRLLLVAAFLALLVLPGKQPVGTGLGVGRGWLGKWLGDTRPQWGAVRSQGLPRS